MTKSLHWALPDKTRDDLIRHPVHLLQKSVSLWKLGTEDAAEWMWNIAAPRRNSNRGSDLAVRIGTEPSYSDKTHEAVTLLTAVACSATLLQSYTEEHVIG